MKKRLMVGLMAGGLMAAMLPGVASADQPSYNYAVTGCTVDGFPEENIYLLKAGPQQRGWLQRYIQTTCDRGTGTLTVSQANAVSSAHSAISSMARNVKS